MQTNSSRVAILIPILNEEFNIKKNLLSISSQTYVNFDVFIQDNASDDNSLQIIQEHAIKDERFKVFSNPNRIQAHENWWSLAKKVTDFDEYEYVSWLAGDDSWSDKHYLEVLVEELDNNENCGAVCPTFQINSQSGELIKMFSAGLTSRFPLSRIWSLCKNWDKVHHIYALYRSNVFTDLLNSKSSKFTEYLGSDWWWTYTFLADQKSGSCDRAIYLKSLELESPKANEADPSRRFKKYLNSLKLCWTSEMIHLQKLKHIKNNYYLAAFTAVYFWSGSVKKIVFMHKMIMIRNICRMKKGLNEN